LGSSVLGYKEGNTIQEGEGLTNLIPQERAVYLRKIHDQSGKRLWSVRRERKGKKGGI